MQEEQSQRLQLLYEQYYDKHFKTFWIVAP